MKKYRKNHHRSSLPGATLAKEHFSVLDLLNESDEKKTNKMKVATVTASLLLIIFLLTFSTGNGQTFQYSRGWTNGKRSDPFLAYGKHIETPWNSDDIAATYRFQFIDSNSHK